ncbi:MAG: cytochrome c peroxidase [Bacteroidota bacterium]
MHRKRGIVICCFIGFIALTSSFTKDNPYFTINKKDVELKIPKGFPKLVYEFKDNKPTVAGFTLGRKLFYDPILSKDSSISCGFCHQRFVAFAHIDHKLSHGINSLIGNRNVPAIQNMIWQSSFMWDGGVNHIEMQPLAPITNQLEMAETVENVIMKLKRNTEYTTLFHDAFKDTVINSQYLLKALAQFTGLMISDNSRYDKYLRNEDTLSKEESNGLKLFRSHCENCHKKPLFTDNSFRNNGLRMDTSLRDIGREKITGLITDKYKFKVPSLRNVELTYPYMHDGRFRTLKDVLDFYAKGDFETINLDESVKRNIGLSEKDKHDIIAFLKTLTDKTFTYDMRFADPTGTY